MFFFFFKQKTAYEIYQCDWSSDVCSSDLADIDDAHSTDADRLQLRIVTQRRNHDARLSRRLPDRRAFRNFNLTTIDRQ